MPAPPITVVSAVRNCVRWIDDCAASVLAQEGPALVWTVVDNASDDGTRARLQSWAARDPRVRLVCAESNLGAAGGTVRGLEQVESPFTAILDGDDIALPRRLARSVAWLEAQSRRVAVYGDAEIIDADGQAIPPWFIARDAGALRRLAEFTMPAIHSTATFSTPWLRSNAPAFPHSSSHDYFLLGRALEGGEVGCLPEALARYRVHPQSMSHSRPVFQFAMGVAVSMLAADRCAGRPPRLEALLSWAQAAGAQSPDIGAVHAAAARHAWAARLPRLALYHARRAVRRGQISALWVVAQVLLRTPPGRHDLWLILRGGLLAAARVDGRGCSVT